MRKAMLAIVVAGFGFVAMQGMMAQPQAQNPCAPKTAQNPCAPRATQAQNPCSPSAKAAGNPVNVAAVNPCHAKMGTVFYVADPMNRNTVTFKSQAPLEDIVGTTNMISGYVTFDPIQPNKGGRGILKVSAASLTTGIPARDEHLRGSDWLDAARYRDIVFEITDVKQIKQVTASSTAKSFDLTLVGTLNLHGKTARIEAPARITYLQETPQTQMKMPGNLLAGRTNFSVKLNDFAVKGKQGLIGTRVSDTIQVEVSFVASNKAPGAA